LDPSEADKAITKKIVTGCQAIDIKLLDHLIIVHEGGYFSFADNIGF
jgi:DNA repair protein RadC